MLATGNELIDDIKRAPDDDLPNAESINEECQLVQNGAFIVVKDYLARSARIHARLIGRH
jgi:hypothetical protein